MSQNPRPLSRRRQRIEWAFLALVAAALLAACGAPATPGPKPMAEPLDCEVAGYPCSFAEVAPQVLQQSMDLAEQTAALLLEGGTVDEAMELLAGVPGMASVEGAGEAVIFRLEGGRPTVVDLTIDQPLLPQDGGLLRLNGAHGLEPLRPTHVVGGGGDKRALVLAAFPFDFGGMDSAAYVAELLAGTPDYAGRVTFKSSPDAHTPLVTVADLLDLDSYDVVYMTTHGGRLCVDKKAPLKPLGAPSGAEAAAPAGTGAGAGDCRTDFLVQRFHGGVEELRALDHPGIVLYHGSRYRSIAVTSDFFRHHYPSGLGDTLFVLLSCSTFADDFTPSILGGGAVYVSWDGMVDAVHAGATAALMEHLLLQGLTVGQAMAMVGDAGFDAAHGGRLRAAGAAAEMRIRDPLRVDEAFSGDDLRSLAEIEVLGTPGDGQPDRLLLSADVLGVLEEDAGRTTVRVSVDGRERLTGTLAQLGERLTEARYRLPLEVALGFDAQAGATLAIEVRLDLPEGGDARVSGRPKVVGAEEEDLGLLWEADLVTLVQPFDATLGSARMEARVDFLRDPAQAADDPAPTYRMAGGEYQFRQQGSFAGDCTVSLSVSGTLAPRDSTSITFDRSGSVTTVSGWGTAGTPDADATVSCTGMPGFTLTLPTDQIVVNIPAELNHAVDGDRFSGSTSATNAVSTVTWTWSFRRVR